MMEVREHYDKLAKQRETFNRILNDEKERTPSLFKNVGILMDDEQAIIKNIGEPISDHRTFVTRNRVTEAASFAKEMAKILAPMVLRDLNKKYKPYRPKTPVTPEDFQALENARIKRESKQAKRVK